MNIVILDTCTITNGDVSLEEISSLGNTSFYDILGSEEEVIEALKDAEVVISNKTFITKRIMDRCLNLKFIGVFATGYNNIDINAAKERGIIAVNVPGYSTDSVAQLTWAMILQFATSLGIYDASVKAGDWVRSKSFSYFAAPIMELTDKTLGIYGYGTIGKKVADIGKMFGMKIIAYNRTPKEDSGVRFVTEEELFRESDFLTFHCALTPETTGIVNKKSLEMMKKTSYIINTSRGAVVVEEELRDALNNDVIAGAGIDVLVHEPMYENHVYLGMKNCIITPHIAWASIEARRRLITLVAQNVIAYREGNPINVVNI